MLVITLSINLTAFSQTGTKSDTTTMCLPVMTLQKVAAELVQKDGLEQENKLLWKNSDILTNQIKNKDVLIMTKDSIISMKNKFIQSQDTIISLQQRQLQSKDDVIQLQGYQIKKIKRQRTWSVISSSGVIAGLVALLLVK